MFALAFPWWLLPFLGSVVLLIHIVCWIYKARNSHLRPSTGTLILEIMVVALSWFAWAATPSAGF